MTIEYWKKIDTFLEKLFQNEKLIWIGLLLILALNVFFKFFFLEEMHLKNDDMFSVFHAQKSLPELYAQLSKEANPPLYFTFLHFWIKLFGIGPIAVKSLSAIFSTGAAVVIYLICRKHMNLLGALSASFLFLFSNIHFDFSHEVRAFSLVFFLSALSIYFFLLVLKRTHLKWLIPLCIINASLPYSHYTSVLLPITEFIISFFVLFDSPKRFLRITLTFILSAVLFIPQLLNFSKVIPGDDFWLNKPVLKDLNYALLKLSGNDSSFASLKFIFVLILILAFIHLIKKIFKPSFEYKKLLLFIAIFFVPIYLNYYIAQESPVFRVRYMLFANLGVILALSYFISKLKNLNLLALGLSIFILNGFLKSFDPNERDIFNWPKVSAAIGEQYTKQYDYFIHPAWRLNDFSYYYDREAFKDYENLDNLMKANNFFSIYLPEQVEEFSRDQPIVLLSRNLPDSDEAKAFKTEFAKIKLYPSEVWYEDADFIIQLFQKEQ